MERTEAPVPAQIPDTVTVVRYQCDACLLGDMVPTGTVFTSNPLQYEHVCGACGVRKGLPRNYPYTQISYKEPTETVGGMKHQRDLLGEALGKVLVAAGMIRADVDMTGPELLLAAEDFCREPNAEFHKTVLQVGQKVARDDGRFYVPLMRSAFRLNDARSLTLARVASDAFDTVDETERFALDLATAWNHLYRHFD